MAEDECRAPLLKNKCYYDGCPGCKVDQDKQLQRGLPIKQLFSIWIVVLSTGKQLLLKTWFCCNVGMGMVHFCVVLFDCSFAHIISLPFSLFHGECYVFVALPRWSCHDHGYYYDCVIFNVYAD